MKYYKEIQLKDGRTLILRNADGSDGERVLNNFIETHGESDNLLTYPEECTLTPEKEGAYLAAKAEREREVEIVAILEGKVIGTAGVDPVGRGMKISHRAEFGVSILKAYWGLGIGRALSGASIECAKRAGYSQLELQVVSDNLRAIALYRDLGFNEYGRNPRGFRTKDGSWQQLVLMRMELD